MYIKTLLLYIKTNKGKIFHDIEHLYPTRHRTNFGYRMPRINCNMEIFSSYYLAHSLYMNLPPEILVAESGSIAQYKRSLLEWLLSIGQECAEVLIQSQYR